LNKAVKKIQYSTTQWEVKDCMYLEIYEEIREGIKDII